MDVSDPGVWAVAAGETGSGATIAAWQTKDGTNRFSRLKGPPCFHISVIEESGC